MSFVLRALTRVPALRRAWSKARLGSLETRVAFDAIEQPWYAFGVYSSALLAKARPPAISVVEFGVAEGRGLVKLESLAEMVGREVGVRSRRTASILARACRSRSTTAICLMSGAKAFT